MSKNYSFSIYIHETDTTAVVYPVYESMEKEYYVDELLAKRYKINCTFEFHGVTDYNFIMAQAFGTKIYLKIYDLNWLQPYAEGYFYLSDCEIDQDLKIIKTSITVEDWYTKIQEIQDTEVDLCKINIAKVPFQYKIPPLIQVYVLGDYKLTNFQNGMVWEQECTQYFKDTIGTSQWAGNLSFQFDYYFYDGGGYAISQFWRPYSGYIEGFLAPYQSFDGRFFMTFEYLNPTSKILIKEVFEDSTPCVTVWESNEFTFDVDTFNMLDLTFTNVNLGYTMKFDDQKSIYYRMLVHESYNGITLVDNDFSVCENHLYSKIVAPSYEDGPILSDYFDTTPSVETQVQENQYPLARFNRYFKPLISDNGYAYNSVGQGAWSYFSIWFRANDEIFTKCTTYVSLVTTKGYFLKDAMLALFDYFNLPLTWYSEFFQGNSNPITLVDRKYPIFTQLTNVKTVDGVLATVNKITLQELIEFVCDKFNLSWHVEGNQFRFEHIFYYTNNYSYVSNTNYIDITNKICSRNELSWASKQNKWQYDTKAKYKKHILKNTYETDYFGRSEIVTTYPNETSVKTTDFNRFYCDLAYIQSGVSDIRDGNFFGMFTYSGGIYKMEFNTLTAYKNTTVAVQNVWCCMPYCTNVYYGYNDYGNTIEVDGVNQSTNGWFRGKIQEIEYSIGNEQDPDYYKLIKTELGIAFCTKIVVNCENKTVKMTLAHDID